jgi:predicted amidohydrolase YtcJ
MSSRRADLVLKNANVITGEPGQPPAQLVGIVGDRILMTGLESDIEQVKGRQTVVIDCQGRTVIPGFNDAHCHVFSNIRKLSSLDLSPDSVGSIGDLKAAIRQTAAKTPPGQWINGTGYSDFHLAEKRHPTRWELDEAAPLNPVVIAHRSLHACVLNSLALEAAGIGIETQAPPGGVIERDLLTGQPNGVLFEMLGYVRSRVIPPLKEDEILQGILKVDEQYLSLGITSIGEATVTNSLDQWRAFQHFKELGILSCRVNLLFGHPGLEEVRKAGLTFGYGSPDLRLGGVKIILTEATGDLQPSQTELNRIVLESTRAGFQVAIHAIERSTVTAAVVALENARSQAPWSDLRHRIEHCSQCPPELRTRIAQLGALVVSQPPFVHYSGDRYLVQVPANELEWLYPFKSLLEAGIPLAGSSDSPVVPNNPMMGIYGAVTRLSESGKSVLLREAVSPEQALAMYTRSAAFSTFEEGIKGTLTSGKLADVVVLSGDPLRSPPEELKRLRAEMTIVGGKVVWER